jgi:hypothetical protein
MYEHRVKKLGPPLPNGTYQPPEIVEAAALALMACLYTFYPVLHQAMAACEEASFLLTLRTWCLAEKDFELAIFDGTKRVFAMPAIIREIEENQRSGPNAELLRRVYLQAAAQVDDRGPEPEGEKALPLLTDPSSLSYFHAQRLVADEAITEDQIKPYLHFD